MSSYTPVANRSPQLSVTAPSGSPEPRSELRAPVVVVGPAGDVELSQGSLLIGRLPECDLLLDDALVSRMHARISLQDGLIVLEDLHSTNGVFVNGRKVGCSVVLCEGDRIVVGTSQLSLSRCHDSTARPVAFPAAPNAGAAGPPPSSGFQSMPATSLRVPRASPPPPEPLTSKLAPPEPSSAELLSTRRGDALRMLGDVAERSAISGNVDEAAATLSGQLKRILRGANAGLPVPPEMVDSASVYALKLARWTKQSLWVDYVVELHLSAKRLMSIATLQGYEVAITQLDFDRLLLAYYVESLTKQVPKMTPAECIRVTHLESFLREPHRLMWR